MLTAIVIAWVLSLLLAYWIGCLVGFVVLRGKVRDRCLKTGLSHENYASDWRAAMLDTARFCGWKDWC